MGEVIFNQSIITLCVCILSILGTIFTISTFCLFTQTRVEGRKHLIYLSIADLLTALTYLLPWIYPSDSNTLCVIQGALIHYWELCSILWTVCISIYLYYAMDRSKEFKNKLEKAFYFVCYVYPFIQCVILLSKNTFSKNEYSYWCWVAESNKYYKLAIAFFYGTVWISWIVALVFYFLVSRKLKQYEVDEEISLNGQNDVTRSIRALTFIPLVFIIQRSFGSANRILQMLGYSLDWLGYLQAFADPIQGFANSIIYAICSPVIFKYWQKFFCRNENNDL